MARAVSFSASRITKILPKPPVACLHQKDTKLSDDAKEPA